MSYQSGKRIQIGEKTGTFSKGYIDNATNLYLDESASPYLRNARLDGQSIIIRPGHSIFATLTVGDYPRGIGSYLRSDPTNDRLLIRHNQDTNKKLVTIDSDGVITAIDTSTDITSDNRMSFQNVEDVIYCMNGSDPFGKLEGTTYTTPATGVSASFAPSFSVVFNGSHWASGWSTHSNIVYKSVADDYEDFNSAGADQFTFEEQIVGLATNEQGLFYFTKNTVSVTGMNDLTDTAGTVTYATRALKVKEGAENHASIVSDGSSIYYLTNSNKIAVLGRGKDIDGYDSVDLSGRKYKGIENIMKTLAIDQSDSFGYYLPEENLIKRHFKSEGATFNDVCIVYNTNKDSFFVDSQKYFYGGIYFKGYNYTLSMIEPKVYQDEYGQDDEDSGIPFDYYTKEFYFDDPTYKKILWESRTLLDINELASLTQEIYVDGSLFDTKIIDKDNIDLTFGGIGTGLIGEFAIGEEGVSDEEDDGYRETYILRTKGNMNVKGKKFQLRFTNNTLAGKVRLKHLQMKVEALDPLTSNLTT